MIREAQEFAIPVVPVTIIGLEKILPRGLNGRQEELTVVFGKPLDFSGSSLSGIVRLSAAAVRELLVGQSGRLDGSCLNVGSV